MVKSLQQTSPCSYVSMKTLPHINFHSNKTLDIFHKMYSIKFPKHKMQNVTAFQHISGTFLWASLLF